MALVAGLLFLIALAAAFVAVVTICFTPHGGVRSTITHLARTRLRSGLAGRFLARYGESTLARTQRRMFAATIDVLPRSLAGSVIVPSKLTIYLGLDHAAAINGFERIVRDELTAALRTYAARFHMPAPARIAVDFVPSPGLGDDTISVEMGELTEFDGERTALMPPPDVGVPLVSSTGLLGTVTTRPLIVGRSSSSDIVLSDPKVSGRHCRIEPDGGDGVVVIDLGSANGTKVNGNRITTAKVRHGDMVSVGSTMFTVGAP